MSRTRRVEFAISDSVWLSMSGRQFRKALSKEEEKNALQKSIPKSTRYATKWAVKIFKYLVSGKVGEIIKILARSSASTSFISASGGTFNNCVFNFGK